ILRLYSLNICLIYCNDFYRNLLLKVISLFLFHELCYKYSKNLEKMKRSHPMKAEILNKIKEYDTIIVHRHVRPDPDSFGSKGGHVKLIKKSFPEKKVYKAGKDEETLLYLSKMDTITDDTYKGALVIVCDTANQERICDERYKLGD